MNREQLIRYSRQLMLPEIGMAGMKMIRDARVLILGAGGLGCPASLYLANSGIGHLTIADPDVVELSNLHRQILYREQDIGQPKSARAAQSLSTDCHVVAIEKELSGDELKKAIKDADLVLDCCDNFASRYRHNAACFAASKPLISGAAIRLEGQLAVFDFRNQTGPCYQCLYPQTDADINTGGQNCQTAGVLPPVVGIIGAYQALEALKILTNTGKSSNGQLLVFNATSNHWRKLSLQPNPDCPVCGG